MHTPHLNPRNPFSLTPDAQEIARRSGNERLVFWTSIITLGFMGVLTTATAANTLRDLWGGGHRGRGRE